MLVLTRKKFEMIQIGDGIVIRVIHIGQGAVKLGIDAPADVRILRAELAQPCEPLGRQLQKRLQRPNGPATCTVLSETPPSAALDRVVPAVKF